MSGDKTLAGILLARLQQDICVNCEETKNLAKAVVQYKPAAN